MNGPSCLEDHSVVMIERIVIVVFQSYNVDDNLEVSVGQHFAFRRNYLAVMCGFCWCDQHRLDSSG
jgi:hypothetical protein